MFGLLLFLLVAAAIWVVIWVVPAPIKEPEPSAPNAKWATYYKRMAVQAQREGDESRANDYRMLAQTYAMLDEEYDQP